VVLALARALALLPVILRPRCGEVCVCVCVCVGSGGGGGGGGGGYGGGGSALPPYTVDLCHGVARACVVGLSVAKGV
jgi:hypothetical protein